jgi:uncharacterized protein (DUF58 family)
VNPPLLSPSLLHTLDRLRLVSQRVRAGAFKAEHPSPRRGGNVEFADFRNYVPGDDFRQIDWNAYARLERLFLRLFVEEEDVSVHVIVDASGSMAWGQPSKWPYAQRLAAAIGYLALTGLDRLSGAALGPGGPTPARFPPHRGSRQALAWFEWLTHLQPGGCIQPRPALIYYAAGAGRAGPLILVSDLMDDGWREGIQCLAERQYEITILHLLAHQELDPELEGDLKLIDTETGHAVQVTADADLLARYRARVKTWQSEWVQFCTARAIHYVPIDSAQSFEELLLSILRKQGVLR